MAWSKGMGISVPMTAAVWRRRFSSGGSRSMRAARTACTVAGTEGIEWLRQARGPRCPDQEARLPQGAHALLQKERIALGACDEELRERLQAGIVPEEGV